MKILSPSQIYEVDKATIENLEITSSELMEQAGIACFKWLHNVLKGDFELFHIFCGVGDNGGDGLVIARLLQQYGYKVNTYIVKFKDNKSKNFINKHQRLKEFGNWPEIIDSNKNFPKISNNDLIIDAIFGLGVNRSAEGFTKELIQYINNTSAFTVSIDFPSGLYANKSVENKNDVIKASYTLTFQVPKLAFLLPENRDYTFFWTILDIGLDKNFIDKLKSNYYYIEKEDAFSIYKFRNRFSHKGNFGHSLIIGGSFGKIGSLVLASKAALKIGSGLVTAYLPKCGYNIIQSAIPEVMAEVDADNILEYFNFKVKPTVIGVGIGIGTSEKTAKGFSKFLKENKVPLVIDADGINLISQEKSLLKFLAEGTIITPHPKEFERLVGPWKNDYEKLEKLIDFSTKHNLIVVLKEAYTVIAYKEKLYFNSTGNPGLATAGSGDVLTGIITGLIAQGYTPLNASILGVYLHGKCADIALLDMVEETFIASDIFKYLPEAFLSIISNEIQDE